ncbi:MAG: ankyrin repeat domain-containing protein, partial [Verrucomicrobia bacterium]|nr:ankyrin repeat domain-containing protein [Verrucomicrobiota bacterium]
VKQLIAAKANINDKNRRGSTALHHVCSHGNTDLVNQLLEAGASIDAKNANGKTPLDVARKPAIRQLLENARAAQQASLQPPCSQLEIDQLNRDWAKAISERRFDKMLLLLQNAKQKKIPLNVDLLSVNGNTPLYIATSEGDSELVRELISANASVNLANKGGVTPLHLACWYCFSEIVRQLLDAGASIDAKSNVGKTPLDAAHTPEIRQLLENARAAQQASLQPPHSQQEIDKFNRDWLSAISEKNCNKLLSLLQQARQKGISFDVNVKINNDYNALHLACSKGHSELVRLLIEAKANINDLDKDRDTPLHEACLTGYLQVAELLINAGADINAKGQFGNTPLHDASSEGHSETVKLLIQAKANVNYLNEKGNSVLHLACREGHSDIARQLLAAGAVANGKNKKGETPFDVAKTPEIRQLLEAALLNANTSTDAPSQSRPLNPRKLERAGKSLLKRVAEHYGPRYHTALTEMLIKNKGRWGIDFARYSSRRIDKSEWLAPFVQFLEAHPRSETASQVVKQHLAFFQFSDSSDSETLTDDQSSAESFVEECLKQNARQPRESQAPLSDYFAVEACQTLFSLKLREWDYMV